MTRYALDLSFDVIRLLRRDGDRLETLETVPLAAPDFAGKVARLREQIGKAGTPAVDLLIPNEQILYITAADHAAVPAALEGATPYPLADLTWTVADVGAEVAVAATTRQTLEEARKFARLHDFASADLFAHPQREGFPTRMTFVDPPRVSPVPAPPAEAGEAVPAASAPASGKRRKKAVLAGISLVLIAALAMAFAFLERIGDDPRQTAITYEQADSVAPDRAEVTDRDAFAPVNPDESQNATGADDPESEQAISTAADIAPDRDQSDQPPSLADITGRIETPRIGALRVPGVREDREVKGVAPAP